MNAFIAKLPFKRCFFILGKNKGKGAYPHILRIQRIRPGKANVNMSVPRQALAFGALLVLVALFHVGNCDIGTAAHYAPPYIPTACFGGVASQFPSNNLFAAASDAIWDNGAACGRMYAVRCISVAPPRACKNPSRVVQVKIVDHAQTSVSRPSSGGATVVLSTTAFGLLSDISAPSINVEFQQL